MDFTELRHLAEQIEAAVKRVLVQNQARPLSQDDLSSLFSDSGAT